MRIEQKGEKMNDLISRQAAIDEIDEWIKAFRENGHKESAADACLIQDGIIQLPSAQPEIVRCKDCIYQTKSWSGIKYCKAHGDHIGKDYDYCSNARRKENG